MTSKMSALKCIVALVSICGVTAIIDERLKGDIFAIYSNTAIQVRDITYDDVTPDQVNFYLFTKDNPQEYIRLEPLRLERLSNLNTPLVFLTHGWTSNREVDWMDDLKNAFLARKENFTVIEVDWREPANQIYSIAAYSTKDVGKIIGEFIVHLHKNISVPLNNIILVGHSLGGHASGYAGKKVQELTGQKLARIIALDPAGPMFYTRPAEEKLNGLDAEVVEVIHSDAGTFGYKGSCGTLDFYPNGGNLQPGCTRIDVLHPSTITEPVSCDHLRAIQYFTEALLNPKEFVAVKCSGWTLFKLGHCSKEEVNVGDLATNETGDFYFDTNREKPFAKRRSTGGVNILKIL